MIVAFDVDGTLVEHPTDDVVWTIFHEKYTGDPRYGQAGYKDYRDGKISYAEWFNQDMAGWSAASPRKEEMQEIIRSEFVLADGVLDVLEDLHSRATLAIISGTIDILVETLLPTHLFDYIFCNKLVFSSEGVLQSWHASQHDFDRKAVALEKIAAAKNTDMGNTIFVGDHTNDISAMRAAGLSIAYNPKHPFVWEVADVVLPRGKFGAIKYLI